MCKLVHMHMFHEYESIYESGSKAFELRKYHVNFYNYVTSLFPMNRPKYENVVFLKDFQCIGCRSSCYF